MPQPIPTRRYDGKGQLARSGVPGCPGYPTDRFPFPHPLTGRYHTGILVNEHSDGDHINLCSNINGLEFGFAHHASRFGRVGAQRCTQAVTVTGKHGFSIEQLDMEIAGKGQTDPKNAWQATAYNLNAPENLGTADINYWVVERNVGAVLTFTRNGGNNIRARRVGTAP